MIYSVSNSYLKQYRKVIDVFCPLLGLGRLGLLNQEVRMKKPKLDDYELFYMELPQFDYLEKIKTLTDEAHDAPPYNKTPTMSEKQVSALARDQLGEQPGAVGQPQPDKDEQDSLFSPAKPTE